MKDLIPLLQSFVDNNGNWITGEILRSIIGRILQRYKVTEIEGGKS